MILAAAAVVLVAWFAVILVDSFDLGGTGDSRERYMFERLFHLRPVEWLQWLVLAALVAGAAYTAGRLAGTELRRERAFWSLIAVGAGLMLIEEAGDVRHRISDEARVHFGDRPLGISADAVVGLPYLAALAAVPVYALLRHGPVIWTYRPVRPYLAAGFGLYAIAAGVNGFKHVKGLGVTLGEQLNRLLGIEQLPQSDHTESHVHFLLVDSVLEESLELLACTGLLAALFAFIAAVSSGGFRESPGRRTRHSGLDRATV